MNVQDIYAILTSLGILYKKIDHPAVFTVAEANNYDRDIAAGQSKNLFLRNKKGTSYYLVVIRSDKQADLKKLSKMLGVNKISFASADKLQEYLGLTPGSVSPFGLINNLNHDVHVIIDSDLMNHEELGFHPNQNTATLVITMSDFEKFLTWTQNPIQYTLL